MLAEGEAQVLAEGKAQVLMEGDVQVLAEGEIHVLAEGEVQVLAEGEVQVLAEGEVQVLADGDVQVLAGWSPDARKEEAQMLTGMNPMCSRRVTSYYFSSTQQLSPARVLSVIEERKNPRRIIVEFLPYIQSIEYPS